MTLGRLTIFCDCSLTTSLAHLSTTVLGQAFVCAAAATLPSRRLVGMASRGTAFHPFHGPPPTPSAPLRGPRNCAPAALAVCWAAPGLGQVILFWEGRHSCSNLVDIARVRPARPDKLELWRFPRLVNRHGSPLSGFRRRRDYTTDLSDIGRVLPNPDRCWLATALNLEALYSLFEEDDWASRFRLGSSYADTPNAAHAHNM